MPGAPYVVSQPMAMDGAYMTGAPYTTYGGYSMSPYMPAMPAVGGLDHSQGKWFAPGEALPPGYVMTAHPEGHTAPQEGHAMSEMASASFVIPASSAAAAVKTGSAVTAEGLDTSATRVQDAFDTFAKKEANGTTGSLSARPKREFEVMGSSSFEPPEQRLVRLQAEVSELLKYTEKSAAKERRSHSAAVLFNSVKQCFQ
eukprot:symbB.v1.2.002478.t1/scaffold99.1/size346285/34